MKNSLNAKITISSELVQYPVIYAGFSHLNCCNSFSCYHASLASEERSQKIDTLPILATSPVWYFSDALRRS